VETAGEGVGERERVDVQEKEEMYMYGSAGMLVKLQFLRACIFFLQDVDVSENSNNKYLCSFVKCLCEIFKNKKCLCKSRFVQIKNIDIIPDVR
jgi:hypothetical protein